uniref:Uncharacterized protein n=1 Tax=Arundo donax TaxID=35708 RepID=A0A0A8ZFF8_ARUDO
MKNTVLNCVV